MSIRKYRSVEQMQSPPARRPLDPDNLRHAWELMRLAIRLSRRRLQPGVRKFHDLEEQGRRQTLPLDEPA